jgi:hypothetical protein
VVERWTRDGQPDPAVWVSERSSEATRALPDAEPMLLSPAQGLMAAPRTVKGLKQLVATEDAFWQEVELLVHDARAIRRAVRPPA